MVTDDKAVLNRGTVDDNINTRDQRRVGIWFLVVTALAIGGLMSLGGSHAPGSHHTQEPHDMAGASGNYPVDVNPPDYSVNRPVGVIEWPGMVGKQTKYLTGEGNSPVENAPTTQQGVSAGVTPNTATDEQSHQKASSGSTPSDKMPPPSEEHAKANNSGLPATGAPTAGNGTSTGGSTSGH